MVEQILTSNSNGLERVTLRKTVDCELSVHITRIDSIDDKEKNAIEIEVKSQDTSKNKSFAVYIGDEDLILFMRNVELFISRNCCRSEDILFPEDYER
jgi:hypothetical protein